MAVWPIAMEVLMSSRRTIMTWAKAGMRRGQRVVAIVALVCGAGPSAYAVDGVIGLNQAMLQNNVVFDISLPGSYRLTSNILASYISPNSPGNASALGVSAINGDVTLDLNGFTIAGPVFCSTSGITGTSLSCTNTGPGVAINVLGSVRSVVIKNGTIHGWGGNAIVIADGVNAVIENVTVIENGGVGIKASNARINHVVAVKNLGNGVEALGGMVSDVYSALNKGHGIVLSDGMILGANASANGGYGLSLGSVGYSNVAANYNNGGAGQLQINGGVSGVGNVCNHTGATCP